MNRIHWPTTARLGEIQVKEFDLEQTADVWLFLDLDAAYEVGSGERSTTEVAVRAAASIADKALGENRAVGLTINGHRSAVLPSDRGQSPAAQDPAAAGGGRGRRAHAARRGAVHGRRAAAARHDRDRRSRRRVDPSFIRPLASLRGRGISSVVVLLDPARFVDGPEGDAQAEARRQRSRAMRHALAEYELPTFVLGPDQALAEALAR